MKTEGSDYSPNWVAMVGAVNIWEFVEILFMHNRLGLVALWGVYLYLADNTFIEIIQNSLTVLFYQGIPYPRSNPFRSTFNP